ncbi:MAG: glycosyltransferase family 39 protein [Planctomycetota bacterium]
MSDAPSPNWSARAAWLVGGVLAFRLVYAAVVPLDLITDEAYYWDWSRHLDWGYYSKPPLVAWVIAASTNTFGHSAFTVRLPAILCATAFLGVLFLFARRVTDGRTAFLATALAACTPGSVVMGLLMTIDAPLMLCWACALWATWGFLNPTQASGGCQPSGGLSEDSPVSFTHRKADAYRSPGVDLRFAPLVTLAIGVGLLAKQTMFAFPVLTGLFLITDRVGRGQLLKPIVWVAPALSLLFLTPVVWWNAANDWITLEHTSHHFGGQMGADAGTPLSLRLTRFFEFFGSQFGVASPVTCGLFVSAAAGCVFSVRSLGRRERFLACFSVVPLAGVLALAANQRVQPNWPAPFTVTGAVLVAGLLTGSLTIPSPWGRGRLLATDRMRAFWGRSAVGWGVTSAAVTASLAFVVGPLGIAGSGADPTVRLRGWRDLAADFDAVRTELGRDVPIVFATGRTPVSPLAFYLDGRPEVRLWNPTGLVGCQYDLWPWPGPAGAFDAIVVTEAGRDVPTALADVFGSVETAGTVSVDLGSGRGREYALWTANAGGPALAAGVPSSKFD